MNQSAAILGMGSRILDKDEAADVDLGLLNLLYRKWVGKPLARLLTAICLLVGLLSSGSASAQAAALKPQEAKLQEDWRASMAKIPLPKKGSFVATYPNKEWREVVNTKKLPLNPMTPRRGPRPLTVGSGNDVVAQAPTGHISSATGTFTGVTGVTSESGQVGATGPQVANAYTIQLNTNYFTSTVAGSPAGCQGWEQFVFENDGGTNTNSFVYIQYWLLDYGTTSPGPGWTQGPAGFTSDWVRNSSNYSLPPNEPITNLANLSMSGTVDATGDRYSFSTGSSIYAASGDNEVNASSGWTMAEFCVVGDGGGGEANFNSGSTIVPKTEIIYGGTGAPNCVVDGFTGETNNLNFPPTPPGSSPPGPALFVTESSTGNALASCTYATTIGDTHMTTFGGLMYDFQASGDFVLAQVDDDFVVQARQVSGAPTWPNAAVNSAIATRMGKTKVAVCKESGLYVNGVATALADGNTLTAPDGVEVTRRGNVYYITGSGGNSVRATVYSNPNHIDVLVGVGGCCGHQMKGLLVNNRDSVNQIVARDGAVLTNPFNFDAFQHHYTDSWRVTAEESLLPVCGKQGKAGIPSKPFLAQDLDEKLFAHARAAAVAAGVKEGPLLDAATLDVAFFGNDSAALAFVGLNAPIAVGRFTAASGHGWLPVSGSRSIWWLLLVVLIVLILWIVIRRRKSA